MSIPDKPLTRAQSFATGVLPDDGVPRYHVKGHTLQVRLPYSVAWSEIFKMTGGRKEPGIAADSKPTWVFTHEGMRRIAALNRLHAPHAQRWVEAQQAAKDLLPKLAPEIDKPVEHATPEPCPTPPPST